MTAGIIIIVCGALVSALLVADHRGDKQLKWLFKPAASVAFIVLAFHGGALGTDYGRWILAGLTLCLAGDVFLIARAQTAFLAGMGAFALGHLAYIGAFAVIGAPLSLTTGFVLFAIGAPVLLILRWLWPHLGAFRYPVAVYCIIISVMVVASFATQNPDGDGPFWLAVVGAISFAISDISVARDQFVKQEFFNRLWGLPLYYAAQLLLAASVSL
ncbi:MAG: lysoplasmalogenase [Pseudomonadota bacterium]